MSEKQRQTKIPLWFAQKYLNMVSLSFFWHFLVNYELVIGSSWLIKTLELFLILFSANSYYFLLIAGLFCYFFESPSTYTDPHPGPPKAMPALFLEYQIGFKDRWILGLPEVSVDNRWRSQPWASRSPKHHRKNIEN